MLHNVLAQRVDSLGGVENGVEPAQVTLRLLDAGIVRLVGELAIGGVDPTQGIAIQVERHDAALIVNGLG